MAETVGLLRTSSNTLRTGEAPKLGQLASFKSIYSELSNFYSSHKSIEKLVSRMLSPVTESSRWQRKIKYKAQKSCSTVARNIQFSGKPKRKQLTSENIDEKHLLKIFHSIKFCRTLPDIDKETIDAVSVNLQKTSKKTIIFDLDETLVHSVRDSSDTLGTFVYFKNNRGVRVKVSIKLRPFLKECLRTASSMFEVIVFTAASKNYADAVLNYIDPLNELIAHRFYRDSCIEVNGVFVKDLRIFRGRELAEVIIVDNEVCSFWYQLDNGIPIISWTGDKFDSELYSLINYMKILGNSKDIRDVNRDRFELYKYYDEFISDSWVKSFRQSRRFRIKSQSIEEDYL